MCIESRQTSLIDLQFAIVHIPKGKWEIKGQLCFTKIFHVDVRLLFSLPEMVV